MYYDSNLPIMIILQVYIWWANKHFLFSICRYLLKTYIEFDDLFCDNHIVNRDKIEPFQVRLWQQNLG